MDITIHGPTFYDQEDESIFFSCIYNLPGYVQVRGLGADLTVSFSHALSEAAVMQLLIICRRWGINPEPLNSYKETFNPDCFLWENPIPQENT
ncbi:hypothetical protein [Microbulbifer aggregans]|uniref:hypothetical protein n=1 Tax=Microbulbifer aggregans TaxID=1769779 RepID=UPI001CFDF721|nr:hypothetical protein [Microbulbifer aggregans]